MVLLLLTTVVVWHDYVAISKYLAIYNSIFDVLCNNEYSLLAQPPEERVFPCTQGIINGTKKIKGRQSLLGGWWELPEWLCRVLDTQAIASMQQSIVTPCSTQTSWIHSLHFCNWHTSLHSGTCLLWTQTHVRPPDLVAIQAAVLLRYNVMC